MAKTLLLTLGFIASVTTIGSYIYYTEVTENGGTADNLFYNIGSYIDFAWFTHHEDNEK
jgi:hypothetical protein